MRKNLKNKNPQDTDAACNRALRYLSLRMRSRKELEDYLMKKGYSEPAIKAAIERLIELKFLNDEQFAESFIRGRQEYKNKSRFLVSYELKQKGVSDEVIQKQLENSQEDLKTAKNFIERKRRVFTRLNDQEFKEKMMRLLSARGFSFDIISKALKEDE